MIFYGLPKWLIKPNLTLLNNQKVISGNLGHLQTQQGYNKIYNWHSWCCIGAALFRSDSTNP